MWSEGDVAARLEELDALSPRAHQTSLHLASSLDKMWGLHGPGAEEWDMVFNDLLEHQRRWFLGRIRDLEGALADVRNGLVRDLEDEVARLRKEIALQQAALGEQAAAAKKQRVSAMLRHAGKKQTKEAESNEPSFGSLPPDEQLEYLLGLLGLVGSPARDDLLLSLLRELETSPDFRSRLASLSGAAQWRDAARKWTDKEIRDHLVWLVEHYGSNKATSLVKLMYGELDEADRARLLAELLANMSGPEADALAKFRASRSVEAEVQTELDGPLQAAAAMLAKHVAAVLAELKGQDLAVEVLRKLWDELDPSHRQQVADWLAQFLGDGSPAEDGPDDSTAGMLLLQKSEDSAAEPLLLHQKRTTVGRALTCDVVLAEPHISDAHCHLDVAANGTSIKVSDAGSSSGTYVNGGRLTGTQPSLLRPGDRVTFGGMAQPSLLLPQHVLLQKSEDSAAERLRLHKKRTTVGRAPSCDVVLAEPHISDVHCHVDVAADGTSVTISDAGSSSGTYVNGGRLTGAEPTLLRPGDRVTFGGMAQPSLLLPQLLPQEVGSAQPRQRASQPMPTRVVPMKDVMRQIGDIWTKKIMDDAAQDKRGKPRQTFPKFLRHYFIRQHGFKNVANQKIRELTSTARKLASSDVLEDGKFDAGEDTTGLRTLLFVSMLGQGAEDAWELPKVNLFFWLVQALYTAEFGAGENNVIAGTTSSDDFAMLKAGALNQALPQISDFAARRVLERAVPNQDTRSRILEVIDNSIDAVPSSALTITRRLEKNDRVIPLEPVLYLVMKFWQEAADEQAQAQDELTRATFAENDDNGDGVLSFDEFCIIIKKLAPDYAAENDRELVELFNSLAGDDGVLDADEFATVARERHLVPTIPTAFLDPLEAKLRDVLVKNATRIVDLFREWDEDGGGTVDKKEFRVAMAALGANAPKEMCDKLFDTLDPDRSGSLEYNEISKALAEMDADLATVDRVKKK